MINRRWLLARRPEGAVARGDFKRSDIDLGAIDLAPGEILIRNRILLCAPTMRNWMSGQSNSLFRVNDLDAPVLAPAAGEVVKSRSDAFPEGATVLTLGSWQDYEVVDTAQGGVGLAPEGISIVDAMGRYGLNSQTGYFGMLRIGQPKAGETVVVSGAAGSTGSIAAQIARIKGCRVIGIAGGKEKCDWLTSVCKLDAAIDYKSENVRERLSALCPNGIDVFYDNVGGETLQAAIDNIAKFGRVVLCGQIASYNDADLPEGPRNMMRVIYGSVRMQGFLVNDFADEVPQAIADLKQWCENGEIVHKTDLRRGFDDLPDIYADIFTGANNGVLLVDISDNGA